MEEQGGERDWGTCCDIPRESIKNYVIYVKKDNVWQWSSNNKDYYKCNNNNNNNKQIENEKKEKKEMLCPLLVNNTWQTYLNMERASFFQCA